MQEGPPEEGRHAAGWLGRQIRRWGWLSGVYLALWGLATTLIGTLAYADFKSALFPMGLFEDDAYILSMGASYTFPLTLSKIAIGIGVAAVIAGAGLTVYLRRKR